MTYVLTLWLIIGGFGIEESWTLPGNVDCARTAAAIAVDNGATLVAFSCVLEVDA